MDNASALIDKRIADLKDWRGDTLSRVRTLILAIDANIAEEWKWRGGMVAPRHSLYR